MACGGPGTSRLLCDVGPAASLHVSICPVGIRTQNWPQRQTQRGKGSLGTLHPKPPWTGWKTKAKKWLDHTIVPAPSSVEAPLCGDSGLPVQCSFHHPLLFPSHFRNLRAKKQHQGLWPETASIINDGDRVRVVSERCRAPPGPAGSAKHWIPWAQTGPTTNHPWPKGKVNQGLGLWVSNVTSSPFPCLPGGGWGAHCQPPAQEELKTG